MGGTVAGACRLTSLDCHIRGTPPPTEAVIDPIPGEPVVPDGFEARAVTTGLKLPTAFDFLPDGRMLVAEKGGLVKLVGQDRGVEKIALDLRRQVNSQLFRGIVAVAV